MTTTGSPSPHSAAAIPERSAIPSARARLGAYALWQIRDYIVDRGASTAIITILLAYVTLGPLLPTVRHNIETLPATLVARWGGPEAARLRLLHEFSETFLRSTLGAIIFLGALLAMNGIVANDRKQGFYRFLFAKPVSPVRYYGQAFLINSVAFLALFVLLVMLYGAFVVPILTAPLVAATAMMFLCYAGITFALSAAARWDWLSLVTMTVAASYLWSRYGESHHPAAWLLYLLPPLHRTSDVYTRVAAGSGIPWPLLQWYAGYGAVAVVIGLIVLRFRRLAIV